MDVYPYPESPSKVQLRRNQGASPLKKRTAALEDLVDIDSPYSLDAPPIPDHPLTVEEAEAYALSLQLQDEETMAQVEAFLNSLEMERENQGGAAEHTATESTVITSVEVTENHRSFSPLELPDSSFPTASSTSHLESSKTDNLPFTWRVGQTEARIVNGAPRSICLGSGCIGKEVRANKSCTYKLCSHCCELYCLQKGGACKYANHRSSTSKATSSGTP